MHLGCQVPHPHLLPPPFPPPPSPPSPPPPIPPVHPSCLLAPSSPSSRLLRHASPTASIHPMAVLAEQFQRSCTHVPPCEAGARDSRQKANWNRMAPVTDNQPQVAQRDHAATAGFRLMLAGQLDHGWLANWTVGG